MSAENIKLAKTLMKRPMKDSKVNSPEIDPTIKPGAVIQADLLFLPHDHGYKYALVAVDLGSRLVDAVPLKSKQSEAVKVAIQTIFERGTVKMPFLVQVDEGKEFLGAVARYFKENEVMMRHGKPNRHRQQAVVERYNGTIGRAIFVILHAKEIETGETQTAWVDDLPAIIAEINDRVKKNQKKREKALEKRSLDLRCEDDACQLLPVGTPVYVISDKPTEVTGIQLTGRFRLTDIRWDPTPREVESIVLRPYQPPLYKVTGIPHVNYTKNQLQVIKK